MFGFLRRKPNHMPAFRVGDSVIVNHVEGRPDIPAGTKGTVLTWHGSHVYSVTLDSVTGPRIGYGVFENDMHKA